MINALKFGAPQGNVCGITCFEQKCLPVGLNQVYSVVSTILVSSIAGPLLPLSLGFFFRMHQPKVFVKTSVDLLVSSTKNKFTQTVEKQSSSTVDGNGLCIFAVLRAIAAFGVELKNRKFGV